MSRIAILGIGLMGAPMARNLAAAGHAVVAWNRSPEKAQALAADGISAAATPREAVDGVDAAIIMVSSGPVSDEVLFGPEGASAGLAPGATVIVMSSIPADTATAQATSLAANGIFYVDAPVSGGERGAIAGTLTIMAGGDAAIVARVTPLLAPLGRVTHVGPAGSGQLAKLANQLIVGITIGAVAEALLLAEAGGADPAAVREALLGGFADSTILRQHGERMISGNFAPGAHATTQLKDMRTARAQGDATGIDLPLTRQTEALYAAMCETPLADRDHSALYLALQQGLFADPDDIAARADRIRLQPRLT